AGMGGDPTEILPTGDGDWEHVRICHDHEHGDEHGDDHDHGHDHGHDGDGHDHGHRPWTRTVTGKVVSLGYDHFGDFTGFVVETEWDAHVVVRSTERRVEDLAREAWVTRAVVRVRLQAGDLVASLTLGGQVEE
ncbi:MAG: hypothetical protein QOD98_2189, partial [Nocardioidaceae bacterium]|nr:hypothetical protein [Nocardioidaceae bacterium]